MDTKYRLLKIDYWIQKILGIIVLVCCATVYGIFFGALGLIPLGAVQVLSGLVFMMCYRDHKRMVYLLVVSAFFLCWYAVNNVPYNSPYFESTQYIGYILFVIPPSLGIWYFNLTATEYKALKVQQENLYIKEEHVLDA